MDGNEPYGWECQVCHLWWNQDPADRTNPEAVKHDRAVHQNKVMRTEFYRVTDDDMAYLKRSLGIQP